MICPRCGAAVPMELPVCGSCGFDVSATQPSRKLPGRDETPAVATGSGSLRLGQGPPGRGRHAPGGLPYEPGEIVLDRYRVDHVIGEGPVGVVFGATDLDADVQVALKVVLSEYLPDAGALRRFGRSLRPAQDLSHENIIRLYELAPHESRFLVAQQLVVGRSLSELLAERLPQSIRSPVDETRTLLTQIGEALAYAHPEVPHTALKPSNVLILPSGVVLTDFCLAGALDVRAYLAGHRHHRAPTRYLAPEIRRGATADERADLYSLAVLAFELLLGVPFSGLDRAEEAIAQLPAGARDAMSAALADSPSQRPSHVDDLVEALLPALEAGDITAPRAAPVSEHTNVLDLDDLEEVEDLEAEGDPLLSPTDKTPSHDDRTIPNATRWPHDEGGVAAAKVDSPLDPAERIPPAYESVSGLSAHPTLGRGTDPEALIERDEEVSALPDIDADGKRPTGSLSLARSSGAPKRPPRAEDVIARMDFEASLTDALATVAKRPAPPPAARRRRRKRPHDEPDPEAMKNRPVAARGEIHALQDELDPLEAIGTAEPAVAVSDDAIPHRREGTAQIPIPPEPFQGVSWWIYGLVFLVACAVIVAGLVLLKRHRDQQLADEAARRRARLAALRRKARLAQPPRVRDVRVAVRPLRRPPRRRLPPPRLVWGRHCPLGMVYVRSRRHRVRVCIDRYEFPNRKGAMPETAVDEQAAAARCRALGKRLCTQREFTVACESRRGWLFAYGQRFRPGVCNTAGPKGERRPPEPAGGRPGCHTRSGIYDLNGNLAEWVSGGVLMGGSAAKPGPQTSCEADTGSGGTEYNGFRCCIRPRGR